jgi:hypothetical protein
MEFSSTQNVPNGMMMIIQECNDNPLTDQLADLLPIFVPIDTFFRLYAQIYSFFKILTLLGMLIAELFPSMNGPFPQFRRPSC